MPPILPIVLSVIQNLPTAIADGAAVVAAVKNALVKAGYSNEEIDAIFADVVPFEQLGIDPNHPVAADAPAQPPVTSNPAPDVHVLARPADAPAETPAQPAEPFTPDGVVGPVESARPLKPAISTAAPQPPPPPFERAR